MSAASGPPSAYLYNAPLSILLPPPAPSCPPSHIKAILLTHPHPHQADSDSRKGEQHSRLLYFIIDKVLCTTGCSFRWSEISLLNNNSGRKSPLKNLVINLLDLFFIIFKLHITLSWALRWSGMQRFHSLLKRLQKY